MTTVRLLTELAERASATCCEQTLALLTISCNQMNCKKVDYRRYNRNRPASVFLAFRRRVTNVHLTGVFRHLLTSSCLGFYSSQHYTGTGGSQNQIHPTDFASECTLPFGFCFIGEGCKLCEFIGFLCSGHVTYQIWS